MGRLIDIDVLFDYFGNDAIDKTTRSNIEYFVSEKGTVDAIPKAEIKKFLEEGIKDVNNNVLAIVREDYIHKADYENRLKADLKAMLTEIQLEIEESENCGKAFHLGLQMASNIIQQKINELPPVTPQELIHGKCNQCKYYEGVHNVQGHAPCSYHKIGGVLWNWYCSQFESEG